MSIPYFNTIIDWLEQLKEEGKHTVEYRYDEYAQDIYGKLDGVNFSVGGISCIESTCPNRIIEYLVVCYEDTNQNNNNNCKYSVRWQNEVIDTIKSNML